jgi:hypothetical protein
LDGGGNIYVTGSTESGNFPRQLALQAAFGGSSDAFVTKLNASGSALVYSTYLGGSGIDTATGIAVDSSGRACITGMAGSSNFPVSSAFQSALGGGTDAFVAQLSSTGAALGFSTYLGGSSHDRGRAIAVDGVGNVYVTGDTGSGNFPVLNAFQGTWASTYSYADAFVTKLSSSGALTYSTFIGGTERDFPNGIAVDGSGSAWVAGTTHSTDFPVRSPFQAVHAGGTGDMFLSRVSPSGSSLLYSTFLGGGSYDECYAVSLDGSGNVYLTGQVRSANFPVRGDAYGFVGAFGQPDAVVCKFSPSGSSLLFSSYLGGSSADSGRGIGVDFLGNIHVTGTTSSATFPMKGALQPVLGGSGSTNGGQDAFVTKFLMPTVPSATPTVPPTPTPSPTPTLPPFPVDAMISKESPTEFVGEDIQSSDGSNQTKIQTVTWNSKASYRVRVENESDAASTIVVTGSASSNGWNVRYFDTAPQEIRGDLTAAVTGETGLVMFLAPHAVYEMIVQVTPGETVSAYATQDVLVSAEVVGPGQKDVVKASTKLDPDATPDPTPTLTATPTPDPLSRPDAQVRNPGEATYAGDNRYSTSGAGQSKFQPVAATTITYYLKVQNDAAASDTLRVTGTKGGNGWQIKYFDALSGGNDITDQVAGTDVLPATGWTTGGLSSQAHRELRVEVWADAGVALNAQKELLIHVASVNAPAQEDVVKATARKVSVVETPALTWSGLTNGKARACAGGVNTYVHRVTVQVQARQNGVVMPNADLTFSFEGNVGHNFGNGQPTKTAKFLWTNAQGQPMQTETLTVKTNDEGKASVTILSSDVISQPALVVDWANPQSEITEVGRVLCDFAAMTSKRGFPDPVFPDDPNWQDSDTGWECDANALVNPNDTTMAKAYVKFVDNTGQWRPVPQHRLRIRVPQVTLFNGTIVTDQIALQRYIKVINHSGVEGLSAEVTTNADGIAQALIKAGERIDDVDDIQFVADNLTQWPN